MATFGSLNQPGLQLGTVRVCPSGPAAPHTSSTRSPLMSPRRQFAPPAAATAAKLGSNRNSSSLRTPDLLEPAYSSSSKAHGSSHSWHISQTYDDAYDSARAPMTAFSGWDRVEEDLGLDEAPDSDPQEWEEMVSLLSFDGEEHKRVMRQMHGANTRVEDMFASFDGDDFEAVLRAARNEVPSEPEMETSPQHAKQAGTHPTAAGDSSSSGLYQSVCALRAAAMAAEAAERQQCPCVKKRRAPLGHKGSGDSWMLQVPYAVAGQPGDKASPAAAAAAGMGSSLQQVQGRGDVLRAQETRPSLQSSSEAAAVQLQPLPYIGMSCDSSSDGGCHSLPSQDGIDGLVRANTATAAPTAAVPVAAAGRDQAQQLPAAASNNIVSSRALISKLAAPGVLAVAGVRAGHVAAATEQQRVAMTAARGTAAAAVALPGASKEREAAVTEQQAVGVAVQVAASEGRVCWSSSSTRSLRRAIARLHDRLPAQ